MENNISAENIIAWKGWNLVRALENSQTECKNIGGLVQYSYCLKNKTMEVILEMLILITYLLNTIKGWSLYDQ